MRNTIPAFALVLAGCITSPQVAPPNDEQQVSASAGGATLSAFLAPWQGEPRTPATVLTAPRQSASQQPALADWRRDPAGTVSGFLRGYVLDHGQASALFGIVSRRAAERSLASPQADPHAAWALATLAALLSGDWLSAREPAAWPATVTVTVTVTPDPRRA